MDIQLIFLWLQKANASISSGYIIQNPLICFQSFSQPQLHTYCTPSPELGAGVQRLFFQDLPVHVKLRRE